MKQMKIVVILIICMVLLVACSATEAIVTDIQRYEPNKDAAKDIVVDFFSSYSYEELVDLSDIIAKIKVEDIYHIMITSMDQSIVDQKSMQGKFKVMEVYFRGTRRVRKNALLDINIEYEPAFSNIKDPDIEKGEEYIVFLKAIPENMPEAWKSFDYILLSDFNKYKLDATNDNEAKIKSLIKKLK